MAFNARGDQDKRRLLQLAGGVLGAGLLAVFSFAAQGGFVRFSEMLALGLLLAGVGMLSGAVVGFLFGIPRTRQAEEQGEHGGVPPAQGAAAAVMPGIGYRVNTNLEQISDWLTKILVGVGLTQLNSATHFLSRLATYLQGPQHDFARGIYGLSVLGYFVVFGFFAGYVGTRVFLAPAFRLADENLTGQLAAARRSLATTFERLRSAQVEMLQGLYQTMQQGFLRSIEVGQKILADEGDPGDWLFWVRLGCAYAQKAGWLAQQDPIVQEDVRTAKQEALSCLDKAVDYGAEDAKALIKSLSDPNDPNRRPGEDDLDVLVDERFRQRYWK